MKSPKSCTAGICGESGGDSRSLSRDLSGIRQLREGCSRPGAEQHRARLKVGHVLCIQRRPGRWGLKSRLSRCWKQHTRASQNWSDPDERDVRVPFYTGEPRTLQTTRGGGCLPLTCEKMLAAYAAAVVKEVKKVAFPAVWMVWIILN